MADVNKHWKVVIITLWCLLAGPLIIGQFAFASDLKTGLAAYIDGNYQRALSSWLPLAESGNRNAQLYVAFMYRRGKGVGIDPVAAARWYQRAAEQGDPNAQFELGLMYELGIGTGRNHSDAVYWYGKAEDQGYCPGELQAGGLLGQE